MSSSVESTALFRRRRMPEIPGVEADEDECPDAETRRGVEYACVRVVVALASALPAVLLSVAAGDGAVVGIAAVAEASPDDGLEEAEEEAAAAEGAPAFSSVTLMKKTGSKGEEAKRLIHQRQRPAR